MDDTVDTSVNSPRRGSGSARPRPRPQQAVRRHARAGPRSTSTSTAGSVLALLGPNGAGKSTLIKVLAGCPPRRRGTGDGGRAPARDRGRLPEHVLHPSGPRPRGMDDGRREHRPDHRVSAPWRADLLAADPGARHRGPAHRRRTPRPADTRIADLAPAERSLVAIARALASTGARSSSSTSRPPASPPRTAPGSSASCTPCATRGTPSSTSAIAWTRCTRSPTPSPCCATAASSARARWRPQRRPPGARHRGRRADRLPARHRPRRGPGRADPRRRTDRPRPDRSAWSCGPGKSSAWWASPAPGTWNWAAPSPGARPLLAGRALLDGRPYRPRTVAAAVASGVGFVTGNRLEEGCAAELTVRENFLANPRAGGLSARRWLSPRRERAEAADPDRTVRGAPPGQRGPDRHPVRRQPAEGHARPVAPGRAARC